MNIYRYFILIYNLFNNCDKMNINTDNYEILPDEEVEKAKKENTNISKSNSNINTNDNIDDSYEPLSVIDYKSTNLVLSVAMRKDYEETIFYTLLDIVNNNEELKTLNSYPHFKGQQSFKFVPKLDFKSNIFSEKQLIELHNNIPNINRFKNFKILYSFERDGISFNTFYQKVSDAQQSIIVIEDDMQNVFGVYVSEEIRNSQKFYGTGETFLFSFFKSIKIHCFQSTMENEFFIYTDDEIIAFGCEDKYFSLSIRNDFLKGSSRKTKTFNNPCLSYNENFFIKKFEVWTLEN